jgi:AAA+ ATPase superfamily predicted ATPase
MATELIDREEEAGALERVWAQAIAGRPQLVVVWGRRPVGKTFLLSQFIRGERSVYLGATQQAEAVELARLLDAVRRGLGEQVADLAAGGFRSWEAALRFFAALAADEPLAVVLDEVPYLARSTFSVCSRVEPSCSAKPAGSSASWTGGT